LNRGERLSRKKKGKGHDLQKFSARTALRWPKVRSQRGIKNGIRGW